MSERMLTPEETGPRLGKTTSTLAKWRMWGRGPEFLKVGRHVFYTDSAIQKFLENCRRTSTSDQK
jgi:hypothetical protein